MAHYFLNDDKLKSEIKKIEVCINDTKYTLCTDNGVFSKNELDFGTRLLLENLPILKVNPNSNVLDMGCGYGPIGIYVAKATSSIVHMVDVNLRALHLAKMNAQENEINNILIYESNTYENIKDKFDFIITNPPIRAGKKIVYDIVFRAREFLKNNGELWLVIRKEQGAKSLLKDMNEYYKTEIVAKKSGFFIVSAKIR